MQLMGSDDAWIHAALLGLDPALLLRHIHPAREPTNTPKKRKVLVINSDDDGMVDTNAAAAGASSSSAAKAQSAKPVVEPEQPPFQLSWLQTIPELMNAVDCSILGNIYKCWAFSWRVLDHLYPGNMSDEWRLRLQLCTQLTSLCNEIIRSLTSQASTTFCKAVLRDCMGHIDAFLCRYVTNSLHPSLLLSEAHMCHFETLAQ